MAFSISDSIKKKSGGLSEMLSGDTFEIRNIPIDRLTVSEKNKSFYEIGDLSSLKQMILLAGGVSQNLEVISNGDNTYRIISGHRRYLAAKELLSEGKDIKSALPCRILNLERFKERFEGLDDSQIEEALVRITNAGNRKISDKDLMQQAEFFSQMYKSLKRDLAYKGRESEFVAENIGVSRGKAQSIIKLNKKLSPELKEAYASGQITLAQANKLADESPQKQGFAVRQLKSTGTLGQAAPPKTPKPTKNEPTPTTKSSQNSGGLYNFDDLCAELKELVSEFDSAPDGSLLDAIIEKANQLKGFYIGGGNTNPFDELP